MFFSPRSLAHFPSAFKTGASANAYGEFDPYAIAAEIARPNAVLPNRSAMRCHISTSRIIGIPAILIKKRLLVHTADTRQRNMNPSGILVFYNNLTILQILFSP